MADKKYTAKDLIQRLHNKYRTGDGYIVMEEVANGTGFNCGRHIDAIVFAIWPSLGLKRFAIEVKVDRGDFLAELKQPQKSQWAKDSTHEFWFLAPKGVIKDENELPENCGWMIPYGEDRIRIVRAATYKEEPLLNNSLLAAYIRSATKHASGLKQRIKKDILNASYEFREAKEWRDAAEIFMRERGIRPNSMRDKDSILEGFRNCSLDKELQKDKKQITEVLEKFEQHMLETFQSFAVLASHSLIAKNAVGEYVYKLYGNEWDQSLDMLKTKLKNTKKGPRRYSHTADKRKVLLLELLEEFAPGK